jgi:hypothetical protein
MNAGTVGRSQIPSGFRFQTDVFAGFNNRAKGERRSAVFAEFWSGREKHDGSFDDILQILTDMRIASARALIQLRQYPIKQHGVPYSSSFAYPSKGKTRLIVPSEREMEENLLQQILNG